mmetsp:Transcript_4260/g.6236  ORF Transcript_4260/g.6236 Transcript_4260/m.6236 type:complete len:218 (-) Transcript_4260:187-840(-)
MTMAAESSNTQIDTSMTDPEDNFDTKSQDSSTKSIDITTEEGKQNATAGTSALSKYLQHMGEIQQEAMDKLFSATVDGPCVSNCEGQVFGERLDSLTTSCRHPSDFFNFKNHDGRGHQVSNVAAPTASLGHYMVPLACEYCGAETTADCKSDCERPKLFFRKQKPPFASQDGWCDKTEYKLPPPPEQSNEAIELVDDNAGTNQQNSNWMRGFLHVMS